MTGAGKIKFNNIDEETEHWLSFCSERGRFIAGEVSLSESALLVVDVQEYFFNPTCPAYVESSGDIFGNISACIQYFRSMARPLIFTRHAEKRNSPEFPKNHIWRSRLFEDMQESHLYKNLPLDFTEKIIVKDTFSAFRNSDLDAFLKRQQISFLFMVGVNTHICIESTAREAFDRGFLPIILADACASWKKEQHVRSLISISDGIGWVARCGDLKELK